MDTLNTAAVRQRIGRAFDELYGREDTRSAIQTGLPDPNPVVWATLRAPQLPPFVHVGPCTRYQPADLAVCTSYVLKWRKADIFRGSTLSDKLYPASRRPGLFVHNRHVVWKGDPRLLTAGPYVGCWHHLSASIKRSTT